jgi:predicted hotdog family 3-hydroxylacyl-ACP dehydratase
MNGLDREQIARCIPHAGPMVLLDEVVHWDERALRARTASHVRADNPLRDAHGLHIACGIEYAAQAMALHGALRAAQAGESQARPRAGLLASVRRVGFLARRLDEDSTPLIVEASLVSGDARVAVYDFVLSCSARILLSGRATVVLDAFSPQDRPSGGG